VVVISSRGRDLQEPRALHDGSPTKEHDTLKTKDTDLTYAERKKHLAILHDMRTRAATTKDEKEAIGWVLHFGEAEHDRLKAQDR
jgi:hypothetical protein